VTGEPREVGDVLLAWVMSDVPNHAAIYIGSGLIAHHLPQRYSREEPVERWRHYIAHQLRYVGSPHAA
jgi:cell wall-associated NlpC family hydrolase